jgi:ubiquinone/menaquinone biosynthesis C-methylase UbiE
MPDTSSHSTFAGSIPMLYDRHLGPVCLEPYAVDLAERVAENGAMHLLETACGTGIVTRHLLERLPEGGRLTATDLNEDMLAVATERVTSDPRLDFRQADAQDLPFPDGAFDTVVCQFGIMFYPDKPRGLREAHRVLRKGGRLLFNVWDGMHANPMQRVGHDVVMSFFPVNPPTFYATPFGWFDPDEIHRTVSRAGFGDVRILAVEREGPCESHESLAVGLVRGNPILVAIQERGGDVDVIVAAVARRLAETWPGRPFKVPLRALIVEAGA